MTFNTGDIVRITGASIPGLNGTEARILGRASDIFGSFYETELLEISPELQETYNEIVPEEYRDEQPIELMNFDGDQLELVERVAA